MGDKRQWRRSALLLAVFSLLILGQQHPLIQAQEATPTPTASATPTATTLPTLTATETPTPTTLPTATPTANPPPEVTPSVTSSYTPTATATESPTASATQAPSPTETTAPESTTEITAEPLPATNTPTSTVQPETTTEPEAPTGTFTPTLTPSTTATMALLAPEPELTPLYSDNFDGGDLSAWTLGDGWSLVPRDTGQALQLFNSTMPLVLNQGDFGDVAIEMLVQFDEGIIQVNIRESEIGAYTILLDHNGEIGLYRAGVLLQVASSTVPRTEPRPSCSGCVQVPAASCCAWRPRGPWMKRSVVAPVVCASPLPATKCHEPIFEGGNQKQQEMSSLLLGSCEYRVVAIEGLLSILYYDVYFVYIG